MFPYHLACASWNRGYSVVNCTDSGMLTKDKDKDKDHGHQDRPTTITNLLIKGYSSLWVIFWGKVIMMRSLISFILF